MRVLLPFFAIALCAGCGSEAPAPAEETASTALQRDSANPNPMLFEKDARPYGVSMEQWSERLWKYILKIPFDENPNLDPTGADCAIDQEGPVWFLPAVPGAMLGTSVTRACTIPRGRALFLQLASLANDYPCPDPNFKPAPGQSLYDFLIDGAKPAIDAVRNFDGTLDGVPIKDVLSYRFTSDDLFYFTGDPSMQAFDSCITGKRQPAVADGYYLMFKPLSPGAHTIVIHGQDMHGTPVTLTENLTIR
ncbi:MAG TPA: hypothetical protein VNO21_00070 [Polyangiaceae bacterium]|nr:hypothetical protein [Polyangiaceae bacterium]